MAAIYAARRISCCALLQRLLARSPTAAAAAREEQRWLLLRFRHGAGPPPTNPSYSCRRQLSSSGATQSPSNNAKAKHHLHSTRPAPWPREELLEHIRQIELKKRELFDMLVQLDSRYPSISKIAWEHRKLIYTLLGHVDANPDDPLWSMYQRRKRLYVSLWIGMPILCAIGFMAYLENEQRRK
ncbi:hypothetical protein E2562_022052 [Oryza meyeriana var. granulata]|uniref:Uncharacterized protein n=1 Tax=Oryza meyeriana var. granulata TaxID=110450 RepID=A0A6G1ENL6_9ORYZ|nr:hypothetical protein E2562_022052 [Oryza meyeriana var. granulata]